MKVRHIETGTEVDAFKHDGTDKSAIFIAHWISNRRGRADILHPGQAEFDVHHAFVRIYRDGDSELVRPGFWVLEARPELFYVVFGDDFVELYEPV